MGLGTNSRDPLELRLEAELKDIIDVRLTSKSGGRFGDGDVRSLVYVQSQMPSFMVEAKRRTTSTNHNVAKGDFDKAKRQAGSDTMVFATQNSEGEIVMHMQLEDFKNLLLVIRDLEDDLEISRAKVEYFDDETQTMMDYS